MMDKEVLREIMETQANKFVESRVEATKGEDWARDCVIHESFNGYVTGFNSAVAILESYNIITQQIVGLLKENHENK